MTSTALRSGQDGRHDLVAWILDLGLTGRAGAGPALTACAFSRLAAAEGC